MGAPLSRLADEALAVPVTSFLMLDEVFALAVGSSESLSFCRKSVSCVDLKALSAAQPSASPKALLRCLLRSSVTDRGAAVRQLHACFCKWVDSEVLAQLPELPALRRLELDGCQSIDDAGLSELARRCQGLRALSLYWNVRVTPLGLCRLIDAQRDDELRLINFSGVKHLSDETLQCVVRKAPQLEELDLTRCNLVTDAGAQVIFRHLLQLRVLRLYAMAQLNPQAFQPLSNLVALEELDLCGCRLEDEPLVQLLEASAPSRLRILNITWCPALTDASPKAIGKNCPHLTWLSVFGNTNISKEGLDALSLSPCGSLLRSLDVRGLTQAAEYATDRKKLKELFPSVVEHDLHH